MALLQTPKCWRIIWSVSVGIVTALNPVLGYEKTTELAKEALETNKGILELIRKKIADGGPD